MFERAQDRREYSSDRGRLLWCIRIWAMGARRPLRPEWTVAGVFAEMDAQAAAAPFDCFMRSAHQHAARYLRIDCVAARGTTDDEQALLDVLALAQEGRGFEMLLLVKAVLVAGDGALEVAAGASQFGRALTQAGLFLSPPDAPTRRFALPLGPAAMRPAVQAGV